MTDADQYLSWRLRLSNGNFAPYDTVDTVPGDKWNCSRRARTTCTRLCSDLLVRHHRLALRPVGTRHTHKRRTAFTSRRPALRMKRRPQTRASNLGPTIARESSICSLQSAVCNLKSSCSPLTAARSSTSNRPNDVSRLSPACTSSRSTGQAQARAVRKVVLTQYRTQPWPGRPGTGLDGEIASWPRGRQAPTGKPEVETRQLGETALPK